MGRPRSTPDLHLLSKVSTLYYHRDETQQQIAEAVDKVASLAEGVRICDV